MSVFYFGCTSLPKKTFEEVIKSWNEAIIQLKLNQKFLKENCDEIVKKSKILGENISKERARNKEITRIVRYYNFEIITDKVDEKWKNDVKILIYVKRITRKKDTKSKKYIESIDESYYLSTKKLSAEEYQKIIRWHWWIENKNHYVKDVSMWEDDSRIRKNPEIFATLRSFWLNIMRYFWVKNISCEMYENVINLIKMIEKYKIIF